MNFNSSATRLIATTILLTTGQIGWAQTTNSAAPKPPTEIDIARAAIQNICPVTGQKLGDHGQPYKVKVGGEEIFLCCKGCVKQKIDPKHWVAIHKNFAAAQKICPVMEHELPKKAKFAVVEGRVFYVCCPPCIDKIKAKPRDFAKKLDAMYITAYKAAQANAKSNAPNKEPVK